MTRACLALALLSLACSSAPAEQPITYCAPNADLRTAATVAADRWSTATGLWLVVDDVCDPGDARIVADDTGKAWGIGKLGSNGRPAWIAIRPDMVGHEQLEALTVHEMGHSLMGKQHQSDGPGIMRAGEDYPGLEITEHDLAALCAIAECAAFAPEAAS